MYGCGDAAHKPNKEILIHESWLSPHYTESEKWSRRGIMMEVLEGQLHASQDIAENPFALMEGKLTHGDTSGGGHGRR